MCVHIQSFNLGLNTTIRLIYTNEDSVITVRIKKKDLPKDFNLL